MNDVIGKAHLVQCRKRIPEYIGVMQVIRQSNHAYGSARRNICQTGVDPGDGAFHFVPRLSPPAGAVRRYSCMRADQQNQRHSTPGSLPVGNLPDRRPTNRQHPGNPYRRHERCATGGGQNNRVECNETPSCRKPQRLLRAFRRLLTRRDKQPSCYPKCARCHRHRDNRQKRLLAPQWE